MQVSSLIGLVGVVSAGRRLLAEVVGLYGCTCARQEAAALSRVASATMARVYKSILTTATLAFTSTYLSAFYNPMRGYVYKSRSGNLPEIATYAFKCLKIKS